MLASRYGLLLNYPRADKAKAQLLHSLSENCNSSSTSPELEAGSLSANADNLRSEFSTVLRSCSRSSSKARRRLQNTLPVSKSWNVTCMQRAPNEILFWVEQEKEYPLIASLAVDILIISGSSASTEHAFFTAGESTSGKRNRLADKNLGREALLRRLCVFVSCFC